MRTVDVVIPCYNYARYLAGCVHSVLSQPGVDVRVLVIDDASSDSTAEVGLDLVRRDSRVNFRRHVTNAGHIATYNEGLLEWSQSDYCALLSADDLLSPGSLNRAVDLMESNNSVGMVYGNAIHFHDDDRVPIAKAGRPRSQCWRGADWLERRCRAGYNVITSPEVLVRGSVQRAVGGYRADLPHAGDLEMWLRIAAVSDIAYISGVPQAFYRVHAKSMMRSVYTGSFVDLQQRRDAFDSFFDHHPDLPRRDLLWSMASSALAREALWDVCRAYDRNDLTNSPIEQLLQFALQTDPDAAKLPEARALRRRQRLGTLLCHRTQLFAASALVRRLRRSALKRRWQKHGV